MGSKKKVLCDFEGEVRGVEYGMYPVTGEGKVDNVGWVKRLVVGERSVDERDMWYGKGWLVVG